MSSTELSLQSNPSFEVNEAPRADFATLRPFVVVGGIWLFVGLAVCARFASEEQPLLSSLRWMVELWAFCMFDLYALTRAVGASLGTVTMVGEKRRAMIIQAFYWGMIKLACLGIFGAILWRGSSIPTTGLLMGVATIIVIPLLGGYWWSQKELRHAS